MSGSESQTDDESLKQDDDDRLDDDIDEHDSPLESTSDGVQAIVLR